MFITFISFSTESNYDIVEIQDTMSTTKSILGYFSGSQIPPVVVSCGSSVTIIFVSDGSVTDKGFTATFESRSKKAVEKIWSVSDL